jgi:hypothetical protein
MSGPLATYTFLPWLRQGIASKIKQQDTLGSAGGTNVERASVHLSLQVNGQADFVSRDVQMIGPGDVIGINPRAIVRTEPRNRVTDFEPNYLAFIEFYDEEFLWRYTPASAIEADAEGNPVNDPKQTKLRPWIFLMVLEDKEFERRPALAGPQPVVRLTGEAVPETIFPPPDQAWAWGHAHVSKDITGNNTRSADEAVEALENLVRANSDEALSRLICPRKLNPLTGYSAFLIPAFEVGRLAGLGQSTTGLDGLTPSWGGGQTEYPVYYEWHFHTGERGDFEFLVRLLEPRTVDSRVGVRDMDMQRPNFGVAGMINGPSDEPVIGLEGALKSPQAKPRPTIWPPADPADYPDFLKELEQKVNLQDRLLSPPDPDTAHPDPIISPPLYGRWHALQARLNVEEGGWVNELNRDARYRVPAGFGTQVIQINQEIYMQKAWQQLGDVLKANQKIRQLQVAVAASQRIFVRHLEPLAADQKLALTQPVHSRVMGSPTTILHQVKSSRLTQAALNPAFRRITRPRGAVSHRALPEIGGRTSNILNLLNDELIKVAPPKTAPEKQISLNKIAEALVSDQIPDWLRAVAKHPLTRILLLALLLLSLVLLALTGLFVIFALLAAVAIGAYIFVDRLRRTLAASDRLREESLTVEAIDSIAPMPGFILTEPDQDVPAAILRSGASDSGDAARFRTALRDLHASFEIALPQPAPRARLDVVDASAKLLLALNPVKVIPRRALSYVAIPQSFIYLRPVETIAPVMAHPVFSDPMYKPLRDISSELLIPNINLIPNNTLTLLETNPRFIESYMVGLNHEMARELLWRRYLTDQRGSYFRQFWDVGDVVNRDATKDARTLEEELRDIKPLHRWERPSSLGTHDNRDLPVGGTPEESRLVFVVRGDLLKKYPTVVIYAQKAKWITDPEDLFFPRRKIRVLDESNPQQNLQTPIFKAEIDPDLRFLGFNLTLEEAKGSTTPPTAEGDLGNPGWFFVIQERPGEPRFGLDILDVEESPPPTPETWNELAWNHLGDLDAISLINLDTIPDTNITAGPDSKIEWGLNAADMAYILYQVPVMVAVHADEMLD